MVVEALPSSTILQSMAKVFNQTQHHGYFKSSEAKCDLIAQTFFYRRLCKDNRLECDILAIFVSLDRYQVHTGRHGRASAIASMNVDELHRRSSCI